MKSLKAGHALIVLLGLLIVPVGASLADDTDKAAAARVEAMASLLAKAQRLSVTVDSSYDVVQHSGQKIEFGERREIALRRPDRARVDATGRDGVRRGLRFDGTKVTVFDVGDNVYATVSKPGTIDNALDHFTRDLGMRVPLRELFAADLPQKLKDALARVRLVGKETLAGTEVDHVAFRREGADVQLWIERDGDPLPRRLVITYRLAEGQPQFAADFHDWSFSPDVPDSAFNFTPAEGATKIPILARGQKREAGEKQP